MAERLLLITGHLDARISIRTRRRTTVAATSFAQVRGDVRVGSMLESLHRLDLRFVFLDPEHAIAPIRQVREESLLLLPTIDSSVLRGALGQPQMVVA
jgi:hypothetical protein